MYGQWVEVKLTPEVIARVYIYGSPTTSPEKWVEAALKRLQATVRDLT